ncbi:MAG: class I SAM-dependent methyltransferase [Gammaproteobacteria bacterium]|nr:class I SAM-dependent methyltransferase [Gammaproteobacteria bacterium]MBI5615033.1 class I SAM-dependent methyltransferase [Gammaproteobacteria bacterium]
MTTLMLKAGREKSLLRRHPWIFSGAVARCEGTPEPGATLRIQAQDGRFLGWAAYSPASQIIARVWSWREDEPLDADWIARRVHAAIDSRRRLLPGVHAVRLLNGESDGLPGVVCDRYDEVLVVQLASTGAARWRETIADALLAATGLATIYERSDAEVMSLEGLEVRTGPLRGAAPPETLDIAEAGLAFRLSVTAGHKTGFYLDQRDNRALVRHHAKDREVLDCFAYSGGFTLNALAGGAAQVTAIESAASAIALARDNIAMNALDSERVEFIEGDVFKLLRKLRDQARSFDLIVLDPPKFAPTAAHAGRAARGYKDINLLAFKLLKPGGLLFTFSCSGGVHRDLFQKIIAGAASDAGVDARFLAQLGAGLDHPIRLAFPEGEYLKGLMCEV